MTSRADAVVQVGVLVLLALVGPALLTWGAVDVARHDRLVGDGTRGEGTILTLVVGGIGTLLAVGRVRRRRRRTTADAG